MVITGGFFLCQSKVEAEIKPKANASAQVSTDWIPAYRYRKAITIYNGSSSALSDYQVKVENFLYNEVGLIGSWHMDEESGYLIIDTSRNARNATAKGTDIVAGKYGNARSFNGKNDYIDCGNVGPVNTVEFYINTTDRKAGILELNPSAYISIVSGSITTIGFNSPAIYINGKPKADLSAGFNHVVVMTDTAINAEAVKIGKVDRDYTKGIIDEVRLYNRVLASDEINSHYQGKAKLNYSNISFVGGDGKSPLKYWMEKDGTFWVKVPLIAAETNTIIYIYYGRDEEEYFSDGKAVFEFFEDFESGGMSDWVRSGWEVLNNSLYSKQNNAYFQRNLSLSSLNMHIEVCAAIQGEAPSNNLKFYEDGVEKVSWEKTEGWENKGCALSSAAPQIKFELKTDGNNTGMLDNIRVRKFIEPEPTVNLCAEQGNL